jgi:hypothetical protein
MEDRIRVSVVDDHIRLVESLRLPAVSGWRAPIYRQKRSELAFQVLGRRATAGFVSLTPAGESLQRIRKAATR